MSKIIGNTVGTTMNPKAIVGHGTNVVGAVLEPITDNPGARVVTSDGYLITAENGNSITTMEV